MTFSRIFKWEAARGSFRNLEVRGEKEKKKKEEKKRTRRTRTKKEKRKKTRCTLVAIYDYGSMLNKQHRGCLRCVLTMRCGVDACLLICATTETLISGGAMLHVLFCFEDELLEYFSLVCNRAFLFPHLLYYIFVNWRAQQVTYITAQKETNNQTFKKIFYHYKFFWRVVGWLYLKRNIRLILFLVTINSIVVE